MNKERAKEIITLLEKHYPHARMILEWGNNFELLVAVILSAQCTDLMVNKVTARLFPKYRKNYPEYRTIYEAEQQIISLPEEELRELVNFAYMPPTELEQDIKSTGFYKNKTKNVQAAALKVLKTYKGHLPKTISKLITIPGVGRKTANVFLGNAYQIYEGIAVDTHVTKQAQLLGFTKEMNPDRIEQDLMNIVDQKDWFKTTYLLIEHGRNMRRKKTDRLVPHDATCLICKTLL